MQDPGLTERDDGLQTPAASAASSSNNPITVANPPQQDAGAVNKSQQEDDSSKRDTEERDAGDQNVDNEESSDEDGEEQNEDDDEEGDESDGIDQDVDDIFNLSAFNPHSDEAPLREKFINALDPFLLGVLHESIIQEVVPSHKECTVTHAAKFRNLNDYYKRALTAIASINDDVVHLIERILHHRAKDAGIKLLYFPPPQKTPQQILARMGPDRKIKEARKDFEEFVTASQTILGSKAMRMYEALSTFYITQHAQLRAAKDVIIKAIGDDDEEEPTFAKLFNSTRRQFVIMLKEFGRLLDGLQDIFTWLARMGHIAQVRIALAPRLEYC